MAEDLLDIKGLKTHFYTEAGIVLAVDGVSFNVLKGETLGLVGESGSGKSVTALSVLRLVPRPGRIVEGKIGFQGEDLLEKTEEEMRSIRGRKIAIIFQDPISSLNPVYSVESQLSDVIKTHQKLSKEEVSNRIVELFQMVGIPEPQTRMREYPHQFSGGMKQRVAVARALACEPALLFADEPTTNLDVTIQAQVLDLMKDLKAKLGMSMVMITHDMGIVADITSRVVVLYAGRVCEIASTPVLYDRPLHPYTEALLAAVPRIDQRKTLQLIPGNIPNLISPPSGCRFHPRCPYAKDICKDKIPELEEVDGGHFVACYEWKNINLKGV
ncbi:ABC transporter ATP-binding protein [Candidatus Bathyarchaeota archaeon]|nr:ABC transporter ATP-binding protein [Candidatus Bathyarchaeota archaeon]